MLGEREYRVEPQWSKVLWRLSRGSEEDQESCSGRWVCLGRDDTCKVLLIKLHLVKANSRVVFLLVIVLHPKGYSRFRRFL